MRCEPGADKPPAQGRMMADLARDMTLRLAREHGPEKVMGWARAGAYHRNVKGESPPWTPEDLAGAPRSDL